MLKILPNTAANVVALCASGRVDASDYENVLLPAIQAVLAEHQKVRVLYILGADFERFTAGAMREDMKLGLGHLTAWEKVAVVTDISWVADATNLFRFAMPCPVKVFPTKELDLAEGWIAS
ncbi:STAS/SEC14 domain-containing protein [Pseudomonas sp. SA3-5]|uniref:STAS/SEC14 domain-containing protein n=1 Tax=Pseudomonas aestuarii TaxID=3018340 RepID=A0ABT4XFE2_9PSED|nr:STAS/SEC14 domain-containing protein [Pseudomonas aestuarii]MDA7086902.1 STAS/SEC14 domain-containing protein [Pseudomonas aestuarii]